MRASNLRIGQILINSGDITEQQLDEAEPMLRAAVVITDEQPEKSPLIHKIFSDRT